MPSKNPEVRRKAQNKFYSLNKEYYKEKRDIRRKKHVEWFKSYKKTLRCEECSENHPATLDFHHIDPSTKEGLILRLICNGISLVRVKKEISKCKVLCANCHRKLHWEDK